jgi:hypothetical protein
LVRTHSAPGTAAPELSSKVARNELETFCPNARLAAQARITSSNMVNFFMETPIDAGNPQPAVRSPNEDSGQSQDFDPEKTAKELYLP